MRRKILRAGKTSGIKRLDQLKQAITYLSITTAVMLLAANFWAEVRKIGKTTADPKSLDGDLILEAQAKIEQLKGHQVIIATTNVRHLSLFIDAHEWQSIN